jgi:hypothetical protein
MTFPAERPTLKLHSTLPPRNADARTACHVRHSRTQRHARTKRKCDAVYFVTANLTRLLVSGLHGMAMNDELASIQKDEVVR